MATAARANPAIDHDAFAEYLAANPEPPTWNGDAWPDTLKRPTVSDEISEECIARAFTAEHGKRFRFDHHVGAWFVWDGARWERDETRLVFDHLRSIARDMGGGEPSLCRASVARGAETFAQADRAHAVRNTIWDADPLLLGTPGGTVDLRTGELRSADPADGITKQAGTTPANGTPTRWLAFLSDVTNGDADTIRFIRQWCGYCLTGDTREHALLFVYGPGGNGKSVFLNTVAAMLGDYAATATMDAFTTSRSDRHSTELAMLRGARLVSVSETEEGKAWAEARIKQITGGDPITARFMRQDNFTFKPQLKLTIVGNHAPLLANVDDAMKRRFNILPFTFQPTRPDRCLEEKLREELPKILAWAIAGTLDWNANGLTRPDAVRVATSEYFDEQDMTGQWLEERCETGPTLWDLPAKLFRDWTGYAKERGGDPGTMSRFVSALVKRGFRRDKRNGIRRYNGLTLRPEHDARDRDAERF